MLIIRNRLWQIGKLRKLLQENKLQRKGKRSRRLSREYFTEHSIIVYIDIFYD